jgi:hypothetical protein
LQTWPVIRPPRSWLMPGCWRYPSRTALAGTVAPLVGAEAEAMLAAGRCFERVPARLIARPGALGKVRAVVERVGSG